MYKEYIDLLQIADLMRMKKSCEERLWRLLDEPTYDPVKISAIEVKTQAHRNLYRFLREDLPVVGKTN